MLNTVNPDSIGVPKIYGAQDLYRALKLIGEGTELYLFIETKEVFHMADRLRVDRRVTTFYLGILDLFADFKIFHHFIGPHNPTCHYIMSKFLIDWVV